MRHGKSFYFLGREGRGWARQAWKTSRINMRICNITCAQSRCRQGIWRSRDKPPHILNLGTWYRSVIGFNPQSISSRYPVNRRHCGAQNLCRQLGENKYLLSLSEIDLLFLSSYLYSPQDTHYTNWATLALVPSYTVTKQHDDDEHFPFSLASSSRRVVYQTPILLSQRTPKFEHFAFTYLLHVSASASVYFSVYVIAILPDEGRNKRSKHLAEDKHLSNTFHAWCQIYINGHLPVLKTSR
jgi:hypothetical protein